MKARTKLKRWFRRAVSATLALLLLALGTGYMALRTSLPVVDGAVAVSGIKAPAEVLRDANGVPHIYAASEADAYFALGFVHAQDRLWQLEARRRLGAGRLSELLGAASLDVDRFYRTLGLYRAAEQAYAALDDDTRALYRAYADGVNGYRDSHIGLLPPEFVILGLHDPEPWRPADSLVVLKLMAWDLSRNWRDELLRARLASRLSPAQIEQLWPGYPATGPVALPNLDLAALDRLWEVTPPGPAPGTGSNNWVVAGHRSTSGRPLLANDPHLRLGAPSPFYLAHISAPGLDVVGATLPGAPGVILGATTASPGVSPTPDRTPRTFSSSAPTRTTPAATSPPGAAWRSRPAPRCSRSTAGTMSSSRSARPATAPSCPTLIPTTERLPAAAKSLPCPGPPCVTTTLRPAPAWPWAGRGTGRSL